MNRSAATLAANLALLVLLAWQPTAYAELGDDDDSASGDDDDSASGDDDDSASGDDDDSASGDDDDSASGDDDDSASGDATETVIRSALAWRARPRSPLQPDPDAATSVDHLRQRDLEHGAGPIGDAARALHLLPGVHSDQAANAWFRVRGGSRDEISIELDGIRIREFTHLTGIMSVIDSALAQDVTLYASNPPAHLPESLSGSLLLSYLDRPHDRFDGRLSLDALGGSAHIAVTLDSNRKHHLVVGARQSFLTAYLAAAQALGVFDGAETKADYGEVFARYRHDPSPNSRLRVTLLHTRDQVLYDDVNLRHQVLGVASDWRWKYSESGQLHATLSHSSNSASEPTGEFSYPHRRSWHDREHRTMLRAVVSEQVGESNTLHLGVETAVTSLDIDGEFPDTRNLPTWTYLPLAELSGQPLELSNRSSWPELVLSASSHLRRLLGPLSLHVGLRASLVNRSRRPYASPRLAVTVPLPSGTTIRASISLQHQDRLEPLVVDRDLGRAAPLPERALHVVLGVDQWFPFGVLLKAEGFLKRYDQLLVYVPGTDNETGGFLNQGTGYAYGLEANVALRRGRLDLAAGYSLLRSTRTTGGPVPLAPLDAAGDQRHAVDIQAAVLIGKKRRLKIGADYSYASGWPISTLARVAGPVAGSFSWAVQGLNDRRLPDQHRVSLAVEGSHPFRHWRLRGTVRLSAMPGGKGFTEDCPPRVDDEGNPPVCAPLKFLPPLMPWLGLQADW